MSAHDLNHFLNAYVEATGRSDLSVDQAKHILRRFAEMRRANEAPPVGWPLHCLVCAREKPWGIVDPASGVTVCVECRDKARA